MLEKEKEAGYNGEAGAVKDCCVECCSTQHRDIVGCRPTISCRIFMFPAFILLHKCWKIKPAFQISKNVTVKRSPLVLREDSVFCFPCADKIGALTSVAWRKCAQRNGFLGPAFFQKGWRGPGAAPLVVIPSPSHPRRGHPRRLRRR